MTRQQNYVRRIQQGATVPDRTQLQQKISRLCDADRATTEANDPTLFPYRDLFDIIHDVKDLTNAVHEEYLDRWARAVFSLFDPDDYQLYRVYAETGDPLLAITSEVQS